MVLGALCAAAALGGCGRDISEREQRSLLLPDSAPGVTPPPAEVLDWLRRDSELVLGLNLVQLRTTALWRDELTPWLTTQLAATLPAMRATCGIDLIASVETLAVGLRRFSTTVEGGVVMRGPEPRQLWGCLEKIQSALRADGIDPAWDPSRTASGNPIPGLGILSLRTAAGNGVVLVAEDDGLVRGLIDVEASSQNLSGKRAPMLKSSPGFRGLYSRLDGTASAWFLVQGTLLAPLAEENVALGAIYGTVTAAPASERSGSETEPSAPTLTVEARLRTTTAERAVRYADTANARLLDSPARAAFTRLEFTAERADVRVRAELTAEQLLALLARGPRLAELFVSSTAPR